jgi:uncharacterized protein (UPF0548 family)
VALRVRRPAASDLAALLNRSRSDHLTYTPIGGSLGGALPLRMRRRQWSTALPAESFDRAVVAIEQWNVHRGAGLEVLTDGRIAVGTNVVSSAPLPVGFILWRARSALPRMPCSRSPSAVTSPP